MEATLQKEVNDLPVPAQTDDRAEALTFTDAGAEKAAQVVNGSGKENAAIRIFIKSGGCSGYGYGMAVDERTLEGDRVFEDRGVRMVIDERSWPLLKGSEVDYVENIMGGGFSVNNPNATSACGCGSSFRTDGRPAPSAENDYSCD